MILSIAATQIEMQPFLDVTSEMNLSCLTLVTGVGPVETAVKLTRYLAEKRETITAVMSFGIGGVYLQPEFSMQPELLDICLATREVVGDLGVCFPEKIEYLDPVLTGDLVYIMDNKLLAQSKLLLRACGVVAHAGTFVTVNSITGTQARGEMLRSRWDGLCENMEGAAVARVCLEYGIPCVELRCISNFVEDRNTANWKLQEACRKAGHTAANLSQALMAS
jgi:futalosine hydrolase